MGNHKSWITEDSSIMERKHCGFPSGKNSHGKKYIGSMTCCPLLSNQKINVETCAVILALICNLKIQDSLSSAHIQNTFPYFSIPTASIFCIILHPPSTKYLHIQHLSIVIDNGNNNNIIIIIREPA